MADKALTSTEVERILGVSSSTLWRLCKTGELTPVMVGRQRRFPQSQILAYLGLQEETEEETPMERPDTAEDRQEICRGLLYAFQATRYYGDLTALEFEQTGRRQVVTATFDNGVSTEIDVTGDSGIGMIKSITRGLSQW